MWMMGDEGEGRCMRRRRNIENQLVQSERKGKNSPVYQVQRSYYHESDGTTVMKKEKKEDGM